jgi:hypothetical protein
MGWGAGVELPLPMIMKLRRRPLWAGIVLVVAVAEAVAEVVGVAVAHAFTWHCIPLGTETTPKKEAYTDPVLASAEARTQVRPALLDV